jgi:IclR family acetate operon transcriptional repressor
VGTSVVRRAFDVLGAFAGRPTRLTLSELVDHTGLPKTTVHRVAIELVELGALERRNGGYALGQRLFELGQLVARHRRLRDVALPHMQDLYGLTHETVQLAVLDGFEVLLVEIVHGHRRVSSPASRGGRMPFHCTGLGKAIVAFSAPDVVATALEQRLPPRTPRTITDRVALSVELARVRRAGVAFDRGESQRSLVCAAAPIVNGEGTAVAALSVAMGHRSLLGLNRVAPMVRRAADEISGELRRSPIGDHAGSSSRRAMPARARRNARRSPYS